MGLRNPIRTIVAIAMLSTLLALLLMPGVITAAFVRSHAQGKQYVRAISLLTMMVMGAAICRGTMRIPFSLHLLFRQVYVHGFGPALIDKTCVRLC